LTTVSHFAIHRRTGNRLIVLVADGDGDCASPFLMHGHRLAVQVTDVVRA